MKIILTGTTVIILVILFWCTPRGEAFAQNNYLLAQYQQSVSDEEIISQIITANFPPDSSRRISSIRIVENYALVSVVDEYTGGVSLLRKENDAWSIVVETGGALGVSDLLNYGVARDIANRLVPHYSE